MPVATEKPTWNEQTRNEQSTPFDATPQTTSRYNWAIVLAAFFASLDAVWIVCRLPKSGSTAWLPLLLRSTWFVFLSTTAGIAGSIALSAAITARTGLKPTLTPAILSRNAAIPWLFLPAILILYRQQSYWLFIAIALTAIASALSLRPLFPSRQSPPSDDPTPALILPTLNGLPGPDTRIRDAFVLAILIQTSAIAIGAQTFSIAAILLATWIFTLLWRRGGIGTPALAKRYRESSFTLRYTTYSTLAIAATVLALIPWIIASRSNTHAGSQGLKPPPPDKQTQARNSLSGFQSVILYQPKKKEQLLAPFVHRDPFGRGATKPLIIQFDGPYWYFKAPETEPGPYAHVAQGKPTEQAIRSVDYQPLIMEANQTLNPPIDLDCCSEIQITLTNADTRPGQVHVGLILRDSTAPPTTTKFLGEKALAPPQSTHGTQQTISFPITGPAEITRFDQLTVILSTDPTQSRAAAKTAVESFTLIPK